MFYIIAKLTVLKVDLLLVLNVCASIQLNDHPPQRLIIIIYNLNTFQKLMCTKGFTGIL